MTRIKKGFSKSKKHKKILKLAKGYRGSKSKLVRTAKEAVMHAGEYAFSGRKQRKIQKRRLWIVVINAALRTEGITYSRFIKSLKDTNIQIDRKILSDIAISDPQIFKEIIKKTTK